MLRWWRQAAAGSGGDANGRFRAVDDRSGKVLGSRTGRPRQRFPVVFGVNGTQYVAVTTGNSAGLGLGEPADAGAQAGSVGKRQVFALP